MSYTALYRKFRPQDFEDVKGQDHIVTALKNQVKANRLGHAYLFTGTRGTGKLPRFWQKQLTVSIRWMAALVMNVKHVSALLREAA